MTTIVWKDGVLACDSQSSVSGYKYLSTCKLQQNQRYAGAICGNLSDGLLAWEWFITPKTSRGDFPFNDDDTVVVIMDKVTGDAWCLEAPGGMIPVEDHMFAGGSGAGVALGALAMGATPEEAVQAACEWDDGTGFQVQVVRSNRSQ